MHKSLFTNVLIGLFLLCSINVSGQRQAILVQPQDTDPEINLALNRHYVARNPDVSQRNQLMVFFPGTGGIPVNIRTFTNLAADMGFDAIGLTYVNDDAINELCANQGDLDCYGNVRLEGFDGTDRSSLINVNRANSIENRLIKLIIYLESQFPNQNWGQYLDQNNQIKWDKIVVAGHSQGGGVAGIIAKNKRVIRSIMFAAMDYNAQLGSFANWMHAPSVTPNSAYFGFSHQQDERVSFIRLSQAWTIYGMNEFGSIINVDNNSTPYNNTHSLNTNFANIPEGSTYHGAIIGDGRFPVDKNGVSIYEPVWRYLLNTPTFSISSVQFLRNGNTVTRQLVGITTKYYRISLQGNGFDSSTKVFINDVEVESEFVNGNEIRAKLPAGKIRSIGSSTIKTRDQNGVDSNILNF